MTDIWILYQTTNKLNGKTYVGVHKLANTSKSKNYRGSGKALKIAIKKYGKENFTRITLAEFNCGKDAYAAEQTVVNQEFIDREDTYNMKIGGIGCKGLVLTKEHKEKIIAANTGKKRSAKHRDAISAAQKGNKHWSGKHQTEEAKARISAANTGRKASPETIAKMSASHRSEALRKNSILNIGKPKKFNAVISEKRMDKFKNYADFRQKKMTSLFEDWIDSLPDVTAK